MTKNVVKLFVALGLILSVSVSDMQACTNIMAGRKATADGSVLVAYCADGYNFFNPLHYAPAATHAAGEMIKIYDWDSYEYLGEIPQVEQTYNVVGNMNEWQLTIAESTCTGKKEMIDNSSEARIDYGTLIYLALERAKTAREAIRVMTDLVEKYGYCSDGETFTIADPNEVWLLFMNGCGKDRVKSPARTVWVALRVPDDCVSAHANYCRLTKFLDGRYVRTTLEELEGTKYPADGEDVPSLMVCSNNVVQFARDMGWYSGNDEDFSYNAAYVNDNYVDRRMCEARVWSISNRFSDDMEQYLAYASGNTGEAMPLWFVPNKKVEMSHLREGMRDHYEGTPFSQQGTIAGGPYDSPYSAGTLQYEVNGERFMLERSISTVQSAWSFVAQMRSWVPREMGCIWFANDEANTTPYTPLYNCLTSAPKCFSGEGAGELTFSLDNAFWVCNWVANMVYPRYSAMFPSLKTVRDSLDNAFLQQQTDIEQQVKDLSADNRVKKLTEYSMQKSNEMMERWRRLAFHFIVKFNDYCIRETDEQGNFILKDNGHAKTVTRLKMSDTYKEALFTTSGDRFRIPEGGGQTQIETIEPTPRRRRTAVGIYSPTGIQRNAPAKGINIENGQKYIVR